MKIVWVHPHLNNRNVGSYRLQTLQPHLYIQSKGYDSQIVDNIETACKMNPDVVVCMQINDALPATTYKTNVNSNMKVIAFQSDGPTTTRDVFDKCSWIVTDSETLLIRVPFRYLLKTSHIRTPLEFDKTMFTPHKHPGRNLKIVCVAAQGNLHFAEPILSQLRPRFDISILTDRADADVLWNVDTYAQDLNKFDVGIVPYPTNLIVEDSKSFTGYFYKDPSRPSLLASVGLPVVMSLLPSYVKAYSHLSDCFLANTVEEWIDALSTLQDRPSTYDRLAKDGFEIVWARHSREETGQEWVGIFEKIMHEEKENL